MSRKELDFDDEARKLFASLNLDPSVSRPGIYNPMDPIWCDPATGVSSLFSGLTADDRRSYSLVCPALSSALHPDNRPPPLSGRRHHLRG
eukprot:7214406-Prymnesium_polylepis.1